MNTEFNPDRNRCYSCGASFWEEEHVVVAEGDENQFFCSRGCLDDSDMNPESVHEQVDAQEVIQ